VGQPEPVVGVVAAVSLRSPGRGRGAVAADVGLVLGPPGDRPRPDVWVTVWPQTYPAPWPPRVGDEVTVYPLRVVRVDRG
jgi:hypothetical protein